METPGSSDEATAARLRGEYGVDPARIVPLSLGADADARVGRMEAAGGEAYFLRVNIWREGDDDLGAAVARALVAAGLAPVVAPLPAKGGAPRVEVGGYALVLYPFVDGRAGWDGGLTVPQWTAFGGALRRIHDSLLPGAPSGRLPRETFVPVARRSRVAAGLVDGAYDRRSGRDAADRLVALVALVAERREEIRSLLRRAEALGRRLQGGRLPLVLCHGDIHTANVMVERGGGVRIVDRDRPLLAPRERDLMFVIGPTLRGFLPGSAEEAAFFAGTGWSRPTRSPSPTTATSGRSRTSAPSPRSSSPAPTSARTRSWRRSAGSHRSSRRGGSPRRPTAPRSGCRRAREASTGPSGCGPGSVRSTGAGGVGRAGCPRAV